ncbi:hypothetical protein KUCAC02_037069, partial [Chaenocephalus aceratus]
VDSGGAVVTKILLQSPRKKREDEITRIHRWGNAADCHVAQTGSGSDLYIYAYRGHIVTKRPQNRTDENMLLNAARQAGCRSDQMIQKGCHRGTSSRTDNGAVQHGGEEKSIGHYGEVCRPAPYFGHPISTRGPRGHSRRRLSVCHVDERTQEDGQDAFPSSLLIHRSEEFVSLE